MQTTKISNKSKKILAIIIFIILASIAGWLWLKPNQVITNSNLNVNVNEENVPIPKFITVRFQFDNERKTELQYPYKNGEENLLLITQNISQEQNWEFSSKDYGEMGFLVTQINDQINGTEQKYWQYFADFKQPLTSVDKFYPVPGQLIEWKFMKSEF